MRLVLRCYLLTAVGVAALNFFFEPNPEVASALTATVAFVACGAVIYGIRTHRPPRLQFWLWVAAALGAGGLASAIFPIVDVYASATSSASATFCSSPRTSRSQAQRSTSCGSSARSA